MNNESCNCHECTRIRWKSSFQGQIEQSQSSQSISILPAQTAIFTDYEVRVLKELAKQTDRHFMPDADKAAEV